MPRVYDSASNPGDFCKKHFPTERAANLKYGRMGDGPDGRGNCFSYDEDHPQYSDTDYTCAVCKKPLTDED